MPLLFPPEKAGKGKHGWLISRIPWMALTDQELVERILEGSEEHFNILYERYFQRIYNFTFRKLGNQYRIKKTLTLEAGTRKRDLAWV